MRITRKYLLLLTLFVSVNCPGIASDSLIYLKELKFLSDFEENGFQEYANGNNRNFVWLFLGASSDIDFEDYNLFKDRIDFTYESLKPKVEKQKSRNKKVALIYKQIHESFLKKYDLAINFNSLFQNGHYNCVTASALYSIYFDLFNIPYTIKEEPTHVYLMAYPKEERIMIETTTPVRGYMVYDKVFKEQTIQYLAKQKLISQKEIRENTTDDLFDKYYFNNEDIDISKLVGLHYSNNSLFQYDAGEIELALTQAEKAYYFYPSERNAYLMLFYLAQLLSKSSYQDLDAAIHLSRLSRFKKYGIEPSIVEAEFMRLTQQTLHQNNVELYEASFEFMLNDVKDLEVLDKIKFLYYYERGRILYNQGRNEEASHFIENSLELQPNNVDLMSFFLNNLRINLVYLDNKQIIDRLEGLQARFDQLNSNNHFMTMLADAYLIQVSKEYDNSLVSIAEGYRTKFENLVNENKSVKASAETIAAAYSSASVYYFKRNQVTKAKYYLDRGLEFYPNNYELLIRKRMISK